MDVTALATMDTTTRERVFRLQARGKLENAQLEIISKLQDEIQKLSLGEAKTRDDARREFNDIEGHQATLTVSLAQVEDSLSIFQINTDDVLATLKRDTVSTQRMVTDKFELFAQELKNIRQEMSERSDRQIQDLRQELKQEIADAVSAQQENFVALSQDLDNLKLQVQTLVQKTEDADSKVSDLFAGVDAQFVEHESSYKSMEDKLRKFHPRFTQEMKRVEDQLLDMRTKMDDFHQTKAMLETKVDSLEEFKVQLEDKLRNLQHVYQKNTTEDVQERKTRLEMGQKKLDSFRVAPPAVMHSRKL